MYCNFAWKDGIVNIVIHKHGEDFHKFDIGTKILKHRCVCMKIHHEGCVKRLIQHEAKLTAVFAWRILYVSCTQS